MQTPAEPLASYKFKFCVATRLPLTTRVLQSQTHSVCQWLPVAVTPSHQDFRVGNAPLAHDRLSRSHHTVLGRVLKASFSVSDWRLIITNGFHPLGIHAHQCAVPRNLREETATVAELSFCHSDGANATKVWAQRPQTGVTG